MLTVTYRLFRGDHHIRVRGRDPVTGESVDTTAKIDDAVFAAAKTPRTSARAERVARDFATGEQLRINDPRTLQRRANALRDAAPVRMSAAGTVAPTSSIAQLWSVYRELNAKQVKPATLLRDATSVRHLSAYFDRENPTPPERITIAKLERFAIWRLDHGASGRSAWGDCSFLRTMLLWAIDRPDETGITSMAFRKLPSIQGKDGTEKPILSESQIFALYDAAATLPRRGDVLRRIIALGISTRLRSTALRSFRGEWADRQRKWVNVPGKVGKFGRPASLPLTEWALECIEDLPTTGPLWVSTFGRKHTAYDADALCAAIRKTGSTTPLRDEAIIILTKRHRARAQDVAALMWSQVDIEAGTIEGVRPANHYANGERITLAPEDAETFRRLKLSATDDAVFRTPRGRPMTVRAIYDLIVKVDEHADLPRDRKQPVTEVERSLKRACRIAGVPEISLQGLRRSGAQLLRDHRCPKHTESVPDEVIERLLEHEWTKLKRAYGFIGDQQMREAVAVVDCAYRLHCGGTKVVRMRRRA